MEQRKNRFKRVMDILDQHELVNNTQNHVMFDKLEDLSNETKVSEIVKEIKEKYGE